MSSNYNVNLAISRYYQGLRVEDHSDKENYRILIFPPEGHYFTRTQEHVHEVGGTKESYGKNKSRAWQSVCDSFNWLYALIGDRDITTECNAPESRCSHALAQKPDLTQ